MLSETVDFESKAGAFRCGRENPCAYGGQRSQSESLFMGIEKRRSGRQRYNGNQCELHLVVEKKQLDKQQMEEYLYSRLPYYMIPKHMHCLEQFPLNTSSKTDRKKIQELI